MWPMMLMLPIVLIAPLGCATDAESAGTGYTMEGLYPDDVRSVAVPIFQNRTLHTGLERNLTDALIKEIESRTPYLVRSPGKADTTLTGTIVSVEKSKSSQLRGSGLVQDILLTVTVEYEWKDERTGEILAARRRFEAGDIYIPAQPVSERPEIGEWAVSEELAQDIVSTMQQAW